MGATVPRLTRFWSSLWSGDLAEPRALRRLRARILGVAAAFSAVDVVVTLFSVHDLNALRLGVNGLIVAVLSGIAVLALRYPDRVTDPVFAVVLGLGTVGATVGVVSYSGQPDVSRTAVALVVPVLFGAVLLESSRWFAGYLCLVVASIVTIAPFGYGQDTFLADLSTSLLSLVAMGLVNRFLRGLAVRALLDARRNEVTDPLTGLANRRGLERLADDFWRERTGGRVLAMVLDVDHFKRINDTLGHAAGDDVLRRLGAVLSASVRPGDIAVRLGGEEFLVLCQAAESDAESIAERLRSTVARELDPITVSIGVLEVVPEPGDVLPETVWAAVEKADVALYEAKDAGRDRVVVRR